MMIPVDKYLRRDFALLSLDLTVADARLKMEGKHFGVVIGNDGAPQTCLSRKVMEYWPDGDSLIHLKKHWPELCLLPEADVLDLVAVASFFRHELGYSTHVSGVVLVNASGEPAAILDWSQAKWLLAKAGIGFEYMAYHGGGGGSGHATAEGPRKTRYVLNAPPYLMVTRYGQLRFPARASLSQPCLLAVTINRKVQPDEAGQVELGLTAREWPLRVTASLVGVNPDDFLITGPDTGVIVVPRAADSTPLVFTLVPQSSGQKMIRVRFEQNNAYLGTAFIHTQISGTITNTDEYNAAVDYAPVFSALGEPPDLTIYIERLDVLTYTVNVRSNFDQSSSPPQEIDRVIFPQPPDRYMQAIFDDLNTRTRGGLTPSEFDAAVAKIGSRLWDELFHEDGFRAFYWEDAYYADTIQIVSDEPFVPWEILRPFRRSPDGRWEAEPFLCERFALARWLSGPPPARNLVVHKAALICPPSNLEYVANEVAAIKSLPGVQVEVIEEKPTLETFFTSSEAEIVHFACHGKFNDEVPARSALRLGDRYLRPYEVTAEYRNFGRIHPLVFVNACDSGRLGVGLTGIDGWAETFLKAEAGVFLGSAWSITDELACEFAETFYELLQQGYCVGKAMRSTREKIRRPGDATHLSYTLYANPQMKVVLPGASESAGDGIQRIPRMGIVDPLGMLSEDQQEEANWRYYYGAGGGW